MSGVCAVLLAAGRGSRYRELAGPQADKLLASCCGRDGCQRPVLEHAVLAFAGQVERLLLVTRPDNTDVLALARRLDVEALTLASAGMGDSLAAAVRHSADSAGWLIALGDMPFILPGTVARVVQALDDDAIVVPTCDGNFGHPVGFGRRHGPALAALSGERGARGLLQDNPLRELAVDDGGVLWDVDTPSRLAFAG
ncbi:nucleotidyltransferase family protein [Pseudomonas sp. MAP12]|uniref:Nucleotidyltransferase family protein n=1 Tax=Geopseudomonas aromaticivorans TaxID=2849492 RepID=A0ABS6MVM2_9GAMM|nr:nucleotidyltransferase family protein [Pseudomonas aromaticivorans]MBV2132847.1 nucleotidyltransferase family protein [Pseudomonas aromaticivorans]